MNETSEILRAEDLCRSFRVQETKIDVLRGISLTVYEQEFVDIMGRVFPLFWKNTPMNFPEEKNSGDRDAFCDQIMREQKRMLF